MASLGIPHAQPSPWAEGWGETRALAGKCADVSQCYSVLAFGKEIDPCLYKYELSVGPRTIRCISLGFAEKELIHCTSTSIVHKLWGDVLAFSFSLHRKHDITHSEVRVPVVECRGDFQYSGD